MIVSRIIGGLGNQMFQYAIAQAAAIEQNTNFKMDISAFETYDLFDFRLNQFNITCEIATKKDVQKLIGANKYTRRVRKFIGLSKYYREKERTIFDHNAIGKKDIYLDGYWQNEDYFLAHKKIILDAFTPKNTLQINLNALESIESSNSVSIHVRRGDYLKHQHIGVLPLSYYNKAIEYMNAEHENIIFYIFTNDMAWCKAEFSSYSNIVYVDNTKSDIEDMWLMSKCKSNIIANSTFSWWSAWLNQNVEKKVICPKKWFQENPKNYNWTPQSWIKF